MPYWPLYLPLHCPLFHYFRRIPLRLPRRGARNLPLYLRTVIIDVLTEFNKRHKWPRDLICFTSLPGQPVSFEQRRRYLPATSKLKSSLLCLPATLEIQESDFRESYFTMRRSEEIAKFRKSRLLRQSKRATSIHKLALSPPSSRYLSLEVNLARIGLGRVSIYPMCIRECTP